MEEIRVYCLYRVSTDKQVDHSSGVADIPVQREKCHSFCSSKSGWVIKKEFIEDGISGSKVSAAKRDAIIQLQTAAKNGEFDVLLVFMFDRIGRIPRETPFVVEDLVASGVKVWSVTEGEQRFDTDTDFLLNYIRFWNAGVEVRKTSERTSAGLSTLVASGHYKGGSPPFGYSLEKGRINKRGYEVSDLVKNEKEAATVRLIFKVYVYEGLGSWTLAQWLTENGYRTRRGGNWNSSSVRHILQNKTYIGILKSKDTYSDVITELIIVDQGVFDLAQKLLKQRATRQRTVQRKPLDIKGKVLLNGLVYCGHCQSRLVLTTSGSYTKLKDGSRSKKQRIRYTCYGKKFHVCECDGQTGYSATILDPIVDEVIKSIFKRTKQLSWDCMIQEAITGRQHDYKAEIKKSKKECNKIRKDLDVLKSELVKAISGESAFTPQLLAEEIQKAEQNYEMQQQQVIEYEIKANNQKKIMKEMKQQLAQMAEWAKVYETASINEKKSIISFLINRIEVKRNYEISVDFAINFEQFMGFNI